MRLALLIAGVLGGCGMLVLMPMSLVIFHHPAQRPRLREFLHLPSVAADGSQAD